MAKRIVLILPLLVIAVIGLRFWLQHAEQQQRQEMLSSLQNVAQRNNERIAQETLKKINDDNAAELAEGNAKLVEFQRLEPTATTAPALLPEAQTTAARRAQWQKSPHGLVVAAADIAWKSLDVAHQQSFVERGKQRELVRRLRNVHMQLQNALAQHEYFPTLAPIHQWLLEVEAVLFELEVSMKPGVERDFALTHIGDLRDTLRDLLGE